MFSDHQSKPTFPTKFTIVKFNMEQDGNHTFPRIGVAVLDTNLITPNGLPDIKITLAASSDGKIEQTRDTTAFSTVKDAANYQIITQIINERLIEYMKSGKLCVSTISNQLCTPMSHSQRETMIHGMTQKMYDAHHMYSSDILTIQSQIHKDPQAEFKVTTQFVKIDGPCEDTYHYLHPKEEVIEFAICDKFEYNGLLLNIAAKLVHPAEQMTFEIFAIDHTHQTCTVGDVCNVAYPLKPAQAAKQAIMSDIKTRLMMVFKHRTDNKSILSSMLFEAAFEKTRILLPGI
jgi:hypothetical protein